MDRKIILYGIPWLLLILVIAGLLRRCEKNPAVSQALPSIELATQPPMKSAAPKRIMPKKLGLLAPGILNLDELQVNIRKYYPEAEHKAGKEGHVMMAMVIGADGSVSNVRVETSGGADFDEAARKVVLAMRFSPARKAGAPIAVEISEGIDFQFDDK